MKAKVQPVHDEENPEKREGYKPVRERSVSEVMPILDLLPTVLTVPRARFQRWYPGPAIMGHTMHWTEYLMLLFSGSAVLLLVLLVVQGLELPGVAYGALIAAQSALSLLILWGLARYQSLADIVDKLEALAQKNSAEVDAYVAVNDEWGAQVEAAGANVEEFAGSMNLIDDDATQISDVTAELKGLVNKKKLIQAEEKALFEGQVKFQEKIQLGLDEKDKMNVKKSVTRLYDKTLLLSGSTATVIRGEKMIDVFKTKLRLYPYLNQTKLDERGHSTGKPVYDWEPMYDVAAEDGEMPKNELLDGLDEVMDSYFLRIIHAQETVVSLRKELEQVKKEKAEKKR